MDKAFELQNTICQLLNCDDELECDDISEVVTFEDAGVMTHDAGLVVTLADGSEYQLTIVRSG